MKRLINICLTLASLCIGLLLAEVVARNLPGALEDQGGDWVSHATRGYAMAPNVSKRRWDDVDWNINSAGFRDYEHEPNPNGLRVVALGDSFLVGNEVRFEDTFLRRLELALDVEVVKLAVGGYGTIQERIVWEEEGRKYRPDLVLLGVYLGNDLTDNAQWPRTSCVRDGSLTDCRYDWSLTSVRAAHWLAKYSMLVQRILRTFPDLLPKVTLKQNNKASDTPHDQQEPRTVLIRSGSSVEALYRKVWPAHIERGFRLLKDNIRALQESVHEAGAELVVIVIPVESQIYDWHWSEYVRQNSLKARDYDPHKSVRLFAEWLSVQKIRFINLLPHLRKIGMTDRNLHPGHWHWSVKANQSVADIVAHYLKVHNLLGGDPGQLGEFPR